MSKNAKTSKKNTRKNTSATPAAAPAKSEKAPKGKPGRPLYVPKFPRKAEWTLKDFCVANEVDPETGKGPRCSKLTLIKWLARDKARKGRSLVKRLDHTAAPDSEKGLGRKAFLFSLREKLANDSADTTDAPTGDVTVPVADITPTTPAPEATSEPTPADAVPAV